MAKSASCLLLFANQTQVSCPRAFVSGITRAILENVLNSSRIALNVTRAAFSLVELPDPLKVYDQVGSGWPLNSHNKIAIPAMPRAEMATVASSRSHQSSFLPVDVRVVPASLPASASTAGSGVYDPAPFESDP